jgi:hypothetical protein
VRTASRSRYSDEKPMLTLNNLLRNPSSSFCVLAVSVSLCGCNASSTRAEAPIVEMGFNAAQPQQTVMPSLANPPNLTDVQSTLLRVFSDDVTLAGDSASTFLVGDFNADSSTDLAVLVKPNLAKLPDLNSQLANWSIQNPHHAFVPPRNQSVVHLPPPPAPEPVLNQEILLAVIHGVGASGWRDPGARQAFLLEYAVGTDMRVDTPSAALKRDVGALPASANVISESIAGMNGVVYWNGAGYAWHREQ